MRRHRSDNSSFHESLQKFALCKPQPDDVVVENIWRLAESLNSAATMVQLVKSLTVLPSSVLLAARSSQDVAVRVAYLSRNDVSLSERTAIFADEGRAEVFIDMITESNYIVKKRYRWQSPDEVEEDIPAPNTGLADILYNRLMTKPTKSLAKAMLSQRFAYKDSAYISMCLILGDVLTAAPGKSTYAKCTQIVQARIKEVIQESIEFPERLSDMVGFLPTDLLIAIDAGGLTPSDLSRYIDSIACGARTTDANTKMLVSKMLLKISKFPNLVCADIVALDDAATEDWVTGGNDLVGNIAAQVKSFDIPLDSQRLYARSVDGATLTSMLESYLENKSFAKRATCLGLLENERVYTHPLGGQFITKTPQILWVKAICATNNDALIEAVWNIFGVETPNICWEHASDLPSLLTRCAYSSLAKVHADDMSAPPRPKLLEEKPGYSTTIVDTGTARIRILLYLAPPADVVINLPWDILKDRLPASSLPAMTQLQLSYLGNDFHLWENFNLLASEWPGSFKDLLQASVDF